MLRLREWSYPSSGRYMVVYALTFIQDLSNANLAIIGIPFDTRAAYRVGAWFGPQDIRPAAVPLHLYNSDPIGRLAKMSRTISQNEMMSFRADCTVRPGNSSPTPAILMRVNCRISRTSTTIGTLTAAWPPACC